MSNETDLRNLATNGLGMREHIVDKFVNDREPKMTLAAHDILKEWRKALVCSRIAYGKLREALRSVGMASYIHDVLSGDN